MSEEKRDQRKWVGMQGEHYALEHLQKHNYRIVARNWRCRSGEIDLIAEEEDVLVFVEVRTRAHTKRFGTPQESVDYRKQQRVRATAKFYLHQHKKFELKVRFDVVAVVIEQDGALIQLEHVKHAF